MCDVIVDYNISGDTIISIGNFTIIWGLFEEQYFEECCNKKKLEKMTVKSSTESIVDSANALKDTLLMHYHSVDNIVDCLCFRGKEKAFYEKVIHFLEKDDANPKDIIFAAVCLCFRVRNNLFHGKKAFWLLNQQKAIIDSCSVFLNEILKEKNILEVIEK